MVGDFAFDGRSAARPSLPAELVMLAELPLGDAPPLEPRRRRERRGNELTGWRCGVKAAVQRDESPTFALRALDQSADVNGRAAEPVDLCDDEPARTADRNLGERRL